MAGSIPTTKDSSSRLPTFLFGAFLILSITMIGCVGYAKYRLDHAEAALAAPDSVVNADQDLADRTMNALGYGGFLGSAQNLLAGKNDSTSLQDMKQQLKTAKESLIRIGDKASAPLRHDIESILTLYQNALDKAEASALTGSDLLPAATALPFLDGRVQAALAANRYAAQDEFKNWGMMLTAMGWMGFILSAFLAVSLYYAHNRRATAPLNSLITSVDHMVRGDMQMPVWGVERDDSIGQLARIIDLARQRFGQIPDISLMSDQGPVRMKFDGESRSLFQALTRSMRDEFDRTKNASAAFSKSIEGQKEQIDAILGSLNDVQAHIQKNGALNETSIRALSKTLSDATKSMTHAQEAAVAQITKIVPFLQDRARNMSEITNLAGTQVTQSLSTLVQAEQNLRSNALQSQNVISQLAGTTNQLGERLFAAVNLMQASGKALNEVTDAAQSRFNEAVEILGRGEQRLQKIVDRAETRLNNTVNAEENMAALATRTESSAVKMEDAVRSMADKHEQLETQTVAASKRMETIVSGFDSAQRAMAEALTQLKRDGGSLNSLLTDLRANNDQLLVSVAQNSLSSHDSVQNLAERSHALMQRLEVQITQQSKSVEARIDELMAHSRAVSQQSQATTLGLAKTIECLKTEQDKIAATRSRFADTLTDIGTKLEAQAHAAFGKTENLAAQSAQNLQILSEQMESVVQRLTMLGQLTGTLGTVAGQLGQLVPTLTQMPQMPMGTATHGSVAVDFPSADEFSTAVSSKLEDKLSTTLAGAFVENIQTEMHKALLQIEAMHDQLAQMVVQQKDQLETRLMVMDKKLKDAPAPQQADASQDPRQTAIISDIVTTLAKINDHVMELDEALMQQEERREA